MGPRAVRDLLVTVWCWTVILVATLLFGTGAILTAWMPPRGRVFLLWARGWARTLLTLCGIPARVEVSHHAAATSRAIFMSNHESGIDILLLLLAIRQDVRFLAKRSLFFVPFMGWSMGLAGFVPVDREQKERAREALGAAEERLRKGLSLLVFPEGTRSRSGELGPFKKSGFLLALKAHAPVVPVAVSGTRAVLGAEKLWVCRGPVGVRVGEPIPTEGLSVMDRAGLMRRVRAEILRLKGGL